ncbi:MAG: hypothetical protein K8S94_13285 [Planctomycetia bacterium]|nr:hypothetical protein [Planctomycetia bacterium]
MRVPLPTPGARIPHRAWIRSCCLVLAGCAALRGHAADPPPASAKEIRERIDAAAKLLTGGKNDEAVAALAEGIAGLEAMTAMPRPPAGFKLLADRAEAVRRKLDKAGADVSMLSIPTPTPPAAGAAPQKPVIGGKASVSFARDVAPILAKSCGGCHIAGRKGDFQMVSYDGLMRSGMVQRGAGQASRLVDVILTGDMPRGGGKVTSDAVATLVKWIDAGAVCDADPTAGIDLLARGGGAPPPPVPAAPIAAVSLKPGDVSFAAEVAPLLAKNCLGCHGGNETEANLSMASMATLLRGGRTGPAVVAGKGAESLLVKKLRGAGIEGQRMPLNKNPLPDADIALIEKWITQGARLDMLTGATPLDTIVAAGLTKRLSDGELAKVRSAVGEKLWRRVIPDEEPVVVVRAGLCVIGNLPAARMATFADVAETVTGSVRSELGVDGPLLKGGVVLYAVKQAFDYSAIWQNVVGAERPKGISSHAGVAGEVVYGAMLAPATESGDDLDAAIAEAVVAAAFAGRNVPAWFSRGAGRALAARIAPKSALVAQWKRDGASAVSQLGSVADFLAGHSEPAAAALAAGGFVGSIAAGNKLAQMLAALDEDTPFDDAFAGVFRATPAKAFEKWAARASR